ncbi:MAG: dihydrolipoyl dehydrogenase [Gammaproteobacteria bacterium]
MADPYQVLVIGGGPGGYVAAIRAAQLGLKTACVEGWVNPAGRPALGGTCLNVGCIPSKALLDSSHHYHWISSRAAEHGIVAGPVTLDLASMMARTNQVVQTLTTGVAGLFKKHAITWLQGWARLLGDGRVSVQPLAAGPEQVIQAEHIVIATGSVPATLPGVAIDQQRVCDSTGALSFAEVPRRLGIIGAGAVGLELGSVWRRLGAEVVIIEALADFLPAADASLAPVALKEFTRQGLDIRLGCRVSAVNRGDAGVTLDYTGAEGAQTLSLDKLVVAVGRKACTDGLDIDAVGLKSDPRGFIAVDAQYRTSLPGVYAIGDVIGGAMLAHKASEEGIAVAERIAGHKTEVSYGSIPWVIYTAPEFAWAGKTEQALKAEGVDYRAGVFPFLASGRARAMGETAGVVKILADAGTDRVLGVHIFGPNASELISEAVVCMEFMGSAEDLARTVHAHPTLAEAVHEAALAVDRRSIHI